MPIQNCDVANIFEELAVMLELITFILSKSGLTGMSRA